MVRGSSRRMLSAEKAESISISLKRAIATCGGSDTANNCLSPGPQGSQDLARVTREIRYELAINTQKVTAADRDTYLSHDLTTAIVFLLAPASSVSLFTTMDSLHYHQKKKHSDSQGYTKSFSRASAYPQFWKVVPHFPWRSEFGSALKDNLVAAIL